jgi:glycosyltransferase involved in cell wall biosynthesis
MIQLSLSPPAISVIMPAWNVGPYLDEAIDSILNQTLSGFEVIIVDDGSTDGTRERIAAAAARDSRIRPIFNERNLGTGTSLNRAVEAARAPWIARMDADDVSYPERLEHILGLARANPHAGLIATAFDVIRRRDRIESGPRGVVITPELLPWFLIFYNRIGAGGHVSFRTDLARSVGAFDERLRTSTDYDFWLRLAEAAPVVVTPKVLYVYRTNNEGSITRRLRGDQLDATTSISIAAIERGCGVILSKEDATRLRHFWECRQDQEHDWEEIHALLMDLAERYASRHLADAGQHNHLLATIAVKWLWHAYRSTTRGRHLQAWEHFKRARRVCGTTALMGYGALFAT